MWPQQQAQQHWSQWSAFQPSSYQNMENDEVDWGAMAQQWIQMKENQTQLETSLATQPPPPPPPGPPPQRGRDEDESKEDKKGEGENSISSYPPNYDSNQWAQWQYWQQHWNPGMDWSNVDSSEYPEGYELNNSEALSQYQQMYWPGSGARTTDDTPIPEAPPPPFLRTSSSSSRKRDRSLYRMPSRRDRDHRASSKERSPEEATTTSEIDATKRKTLPGWIREGLEKMERERLKKQNKEKEMKEREEQLKNVASEKQANGDPTQSKFDAPDSASEEEQEVEKTGAKSPEPPIPQLRKRRSRFDVTENETGPPVKSREELMQDMMIIVRHTLTEILLEVTNEEIFTVADDAFSRAKAKGLGVYASDSDEDDSDGEHGDEDSDRELQTTIIKKKKQFHHTEQMIGEYISRQEGLEKAKELKAKEEEEQQQQQQQQVTQQQSTESPGSNSEVEPPAAEQENWRPGFTVDGENRDPGFIAPEGADRRLELHLQEKLMKLTADQLAREQAQENDQKGRHSPVGSATDTESSSSDSSSSGSRKRLKKRKRKEKKKRKKSKKKKAKKRKKRKRSTSSSETESSEEEESGQEKLDMSGEEDSRREEGMPRAYNRRREDYSTESRYSSQYSRERDRSRDRSRDRHRSGEKQSSWLRDRERRERKEREERRRSTYDDYSRSRSRRERSRSNDSSGWRRYRR